MSTTDFQPGDVIFLERPIPGIPWPSGYYVLRALSAALAEVALVSNDAQGLYGIDNPYEISVEDLSAFSPTGERARIAR